MHEAGGHIAKRAFAPEGALQKRGCASKKCLEYEPFGSLLPGRSYNAGSSRYLFQGQEHDDEINGSVGTSYAYEYRMHDPRVGRFLSIDPLAAKYPYWTPYAFSGNRVIDARELEGLEPTKETLPGGRSVAAPLSTWGNDNPSLAEGDFGSVDGQLSMYHCGVVNDDGSTYGAGWYGAGDYTQFAFSPNTNNSELPATFAANSVIEQSGGSRLPMESYSGVDPNSGRNPDLYGPMTAPTTFPPGPVGLTPVYPERDILMIGRLLLSAPTAAEVDAIGAKAPVGRSGNPMDVAPYNTPTVINGRAYSGHALDQMQGRGLVPSVVENTINVGVPYATRAGTSGFFDAVNNLRVIINTNTGRVITTIPGAP